MTRSDAITAVAAKEAELRRLGATSVSLFGSVARGTQHVGSDVDMFIDYDRASAFNAFDLLRIRDLLQAACEARVDVTTRDALHPRLRAEIETSAVRVF